MQSSVCTNAHVTHVHVLPHTHVKKSTSVHTSALKKEKKNTYRACAAHMDGGESGSLRKHEG